MGHIGTAVVAGLALSLPLSIVDSIAKVQGLSGDHIETRREMPEALLQPGDPDSKYAQLSSVMIVFEAATSTFERMPSSAPIISRLH